MEEKSKITIELARELSSIGDSYVKYLFNRLEDARSIGVNEIIEYSSVEAWKKILDYYGFTIITKPAGLVNMTVISWENDDPFIRYNNDTKFINAYNQILKVCSIGGNCITHMNIDIDVANELRKKGYNVNRLPMGEYYVLWG